MFADLLFFMFASILLLGGVGVVSAKNPMYCVLFLVLTFFNAAGLFLLLGAEFLALLLVMVYVGAIAVMFLFVLMTINIDFAVLKDGFANYMPIGALVGGFLLLETVMAAWGGLFAGPVRARASLPSGDEQNIVELGNVLFTNYVLPFQMAAMILLVAMVGAIVLTHRRREGVKRQNVPQQVMKPRDECVELMNPKPGAGVKIN